MIQNFENASKTSKIKSRIDRIDFANENQKLATNRRRRFKSFSHDLEWCNELDFDANKYEIKSDDINKRNTLCLKGIYFYEIHRRRETRSFESHFFSHQRLKNEEENSYKENSISF